MIGCNVSLINIDMLTDSLDNGEAFNIISHKRGKIHNAKN